MPLFRLKKSNLKSNMDRFIDEEENKMVRDWENLKSNMDRFIVKK